MAGRMVRSCVQMALKAANSVVGLAGMAVILYALWMLRAWYKEVVDRHQHLPVPCTSAGRDSALGWKDGKELAEGHLSSTAFDRNCMILFDRIAAEALVYGETEGGENDENLFRSLCILLDPLLSVAQMANRARWSTMQSYNLLKWHKKAHRVAVKTLEDGHSISTVIRRRSHCL